MIFDTEIPTCREGVFVPAPFAGPKEITDIVQTAEKLGYFAVWATDFVTPTPSFGIPDSQAPRWYEPLVALAFSAAVTERIRLGTGVLVLPYRDPVILAKQVATLDQMSGGRLLLGVGLGAFRDEFDAIRARFRKAHRGKILDEHLEALHRLLDSEQRDVSFAGEYVNLRDVNLNPKPLQTPLPIYLPGRSCQSLERIVRWGSGCMVAGAAARERITALQEVAERHGRDPSAFDVIAEADVCLDKSHEAAVRRYRESRMGQYRARRHNLEQIVTDHWIGEPSEVAAKIDALRKQGIKHVNLLHVAGDSVQAMKEQLHQFAEEIIPQVT